MTGSPPKISDLTYDDIVRVTEELATRWSPWKRPDSDNPDVGHALIRIFARMAEVATERLNRVPDKNFLAFLDLIGTHLRPPQPARVPLTFALAAGTPLGAFVPRGTQIAAPPEGDGDEIVFETDADLAVTAAELASVFVRDPGTDVYANYTSPATGLEDAPFSAFSGSQPIEHILYVAADDRFTLEAAKDMTLTITTPSDADYATYMNELPIAWEHWDAEREGWAALTPQPRGRTQDTKWILEFQSFPALARTAVNGVDAAWLRARLLSWEPSAAPEDTTPPDDSPVPDKPRDKPKPRERRTQTELLFKLGDGSAVEYPLFVFGEKSTGSLVLRFDDPFKPGQKRVDIRLSFALERAGKPSPDAVVRWQIRAGQDKWTVVGTSGPGAKKQLGFEDTTQGFTRDGVVSFSLRDTLVRTEAPRQYSLRAFVFKGGYEASPVVRSLQGWVPAPRAAPSAPAPAPVPQPAPRKSKPASDELRRKLSREPDKATRQRRHLPLDALFDLRAPFPPFGRDELPQVLTLSFGEGFVPSGANVTLTFRLMEPGVGTESLMLYWEYSTPKGWATLGVSTIGRAKGIEDETDCFTKDTRDEITISFEARRDWAIRARGAKRGRWLRARIRRGDYASAQQRPLVRSVKASYEWSGAVMDEPRVAAIDAAVTIVQLPVLPEKAYTNAVALDLSKPFFPFGENPVFNDTFYVACTEAIAKPPVKVSLKVNVAPGAEPSNDIELVWEISHGREWLEVGRSTKRGAAKDGSFVDETNCLSKADPINALDVSFTLSEAVDPGVVNGEEGYWIRATIAKGNYGTPASYQEKDGKFELVESSLHPPLLNSLRVEYDQNPSGPPTACLTYNDYRYEDHLVIPEEPGYFLPFVRSKGDPALYLGFSSPGPLANRAITLYAQVEVPTQRTVGSAGATNTARVVWEYATQPDPGPATWRRLDVRDQTSALAERGLITFLPPPELALRTDFDETRYWIRACWRPKVEPDGSQPEQPRIRLLLTNTTWATQATTVHDEVLGSGTGQANQTLDVTHTPVLLGPRLEVREDETPPAVELAAIETGDDNVLTPVEDAQDSHEVWVRWCEQPHFHGSGPRDRHYVIDAINGQVRFGDGRQGMIPPERPNNIRLARYRTGGGTAGNVPALTITELKSAVPYIDGVTNHEASAGGSEAESIEQVRTRGPKQLRHRGRAVTLQDFEDLAYEASPDVARARALEAGPDSKGNVELIVVPRELGERPTPSLGLLQRIERYILARCAPAVALQVQGPDPVRVDVVVHVVLVSVTRAEEVETAILEALRRFLHPLTGGSDGKGTTFGRLVRESDIYGLIMSISGVDHITALEVNLTPKNPEPADRFLTYSGSHKVVFVAGESN